MVGKRHPGPGGQAGPAAVPLYGFQPPVGTPYGLEVSTVEDFFAQHDDWPWNPPRPGRATFHYLIAVTEGELRHDVDHITRTVAPGQWLWVRPGHAQCWHPPDAARGPFILFEPEVLRPDLARLLAPLTTHEAPAVLSPHADDAAWLRLTALQLLDEHRALGRRPLPVHHALRRSLLESLLLRLANSPGIAPTATATTTAGTGRADRYGRFLDALEMHFRELHQAADYAELLDCSVRTLSRAARDATGKGYANSSTSGASWKPGACWELPGGMPRRWPPISASPTPRTSAASSATAPASPRPPSPPAQRGPTRDGNKAEAPCPWEAMTPVAVRVNARWAHWWSVGVRELQCSPPGQRQVGAHLAPVNSPPSPRSLEPAYGQTRASFGECSGRAAAGSGDVSAPVGKAARQRSLLRRGGRRWWGPRRVRRRPR